MCRVVRAPLFLKHFGSDRSHVKNSYPPPPQWKLIVAEDGPQVNLERYTKMANTDVLADIDKESIEAALTQELGVVLYIKSATIIVAGPPPATCLLFLSLSHEQGSDLRASLPRYFNKNKTTLRSIANSSRSWTSRGKCKMVASKDGKPAGLMYPLVPTYKKKQADGRSLHSPHSLSEADEYVSYGCKVFAMGAVLGCCVTEFQASWMSLAGMLS